MSIITAVCAQFGMRLIATADACAPRAARGRARGRAAAPAVCHFSQSRSFIIFFVFNSLLCGYLVLGDSRFGLRRQKQPRARVSRRQLAGSAYSQARVSRVCTLP